jgi:hypothetical protein
MGKFHDITARTTPSAGRLQNSCGPPGRRCRAAPTSHLRATCSRQLVDAVRWRLTRQIVPLPSSVTNYDPDGKNEKIVATGFGTAEGRDFLMHARIGVLSSSGRLIRLAKIRIGGDGNRSAWMIARQLAFREQSTIAERFLFWRLRIRIDPFRVTAGLRSAPHSNCFLCLAPRHCSTGKYLDCRVISCRGDDNYDNAENETRS